ITCLGCESAVRELDDTPCPNCGRCGLCGRKLTKDEVHCPMGHATDAESIARFPREWVIPEQEVPRERRRMEIRRELVWPKQIAIAILCSVSIIGGFVVRDVIGARTVANTIAVATATTLLLVTTVFGLQRLFRKLENRRLENDTFAS